MNKRISVSTPSRICLFGEHLDYLGLEVIASAIDLRFRARAEARDDRKIVIRIRDVRLDYLGAKNESGQYEEHVIDLNGPILYEQKRDYLKSVVNVLLRNGCDMGGGFDIVMDSEIPIGKGMCSSTTMIMALIKVLLEMTGSPDRDDAGKAALLGFKAEVAEFNEPGGMMDHYTSAFGGMVHLKFNDTTEVERIDRKLPGCFILFDSLEQKNTTKVLADAKAPVLEALKQLGVTGLSRIREFYSDEENIGRLDGLEETYRRKLEASMDNFRLLKRAEGMLKGDGFTPEGFGKLIRAHHENLRDGLGISTPVIERIFRTAYANGALGGKVNGSGGGGCLYVYAYEEDCGRILEAVRDIGYPGMKMKQDGGIRIDKEEEI